VRDLATFAGLTLADDALARVTAALGVDAMKQRNPQHVRKGGSGGFRAALTARQQERALAICAPTMRELGYEV
jgi:hypothetical protein